jgi:hypothetical protein
MTVAAVKVVVYTRSSVRVHCSALSGGYSTEHCASQLEAVDIGEDVVVAFLNIGTFGTISS